MSQIVVVPGPGTEMHYASNHLRKTPTFSLQKGPQPSELAGGTNEAGRARAVLPGTGPPRLAATCGLRSGLGAAMHNCRVMTRTPGWDTPHSQDLLRQPKKGCTPTATQTRAHRGRHALPQPIVGGQEHPLTSDLTPRAGAFTLPGGGAPVYPAPPLCPLRGSRGWESGLARLGPLKASRAARDVGKGGDLPSDARLPPPGPRPTAWLRPRPPAPA